MVETISLTCPISAKEFKCRQNEGVAYQTVSSGQDRPRRIYFSPYSQVGIAYPVLSDARLNEIYATGQYWKSKKRETFNPRTNPRLYAMAVARWQTIEPFMKPFAGRPVSILDIGAGHGFLGMLAAGSSTVDLTRYHAVEMDPWYRESLELTWKEQYPRVDFAAYESAKQFKPSYDLVILSHIVEHVNNPKGLLTLAKGLLRKGGLIFIDVPHQDYRFKEDVFPHVLFFNKNSLQNLSESTGLTTVMVECFGRDVETSPLNAKQEKTFLSFTNRVMSRFRHVLPMGVLLEFYRRYLGASQRNGNGTWIRLIAQNI